MGLPARKVDTSVKKEKKRYFRKHENLFKVLEKVKLWPSRSGTLHGIKTITVQGAYIELNTHCGHKLLVKNSKTSRVARWLRNKWYAKPCLSCKIPAWKLVKYSVTSFK